MGFMSQRNAFVLAIILAGVTHHVTALSTSLRFIKVGTNGETLTNSSLLAEIRDPFEGFANGRFLSLSTCAAMCAKYTNCTTYSVGVAFGRTTCKIGTDSAAREPLSGSKVYEKVQQALMGTTLEGQPCTEDAACIGYPLMKCTSMMCLCPESHAVSMDLSACLPFVDIGGPCVEQSQCPYGCTDGICTCQDPSAEAVAFIPGPANTSCIDANMTQIDISTSLPYNLSYPFPRENYTSDLTISWCLEAAPSVAGLNATVAFWDVEFWYDRVAILSNCTLDKATVHKFYKDDATEDWVEPPTVTTDTGNHIGVQFTTDYSNSGSGFTITFSAP